MTAEPIRRPEDEAATEPAPEREAAMDAAVPVDDPAALTPEAAASAEAAASEEAAASAEVAATSESASPSPEPGEGVITSETVAADVQDAPTTAQAVATVDAASDHGVVAPAKTTGRRFAAPLRQAAIAVISILLLAGGVALGNYLFLETRPAPTAIGDPGVDLQSPPPAAQEFISALAVNDADAIRSSLDRDPHLDLTREMSKYGIQRVDRIEVLGTTVDGPRSATEILMHYEREDGIAFAINLVILVDDGKIEGFR